MNWDIGGYAPGDIEVVAAFDIDKRKVGHDVNEAIFAAPNCTAEFYSELPKSGVLVKMGKILDGLSGHMKHYEDKRTFVMADALEPTEEEVIQTIKDSGAEILLNYLPVGPEDAARFYAECALEAGVAFINTIISPQSSSPAIRPGQSVLKREISLLSAMILKRNLAQRSLTFTKDSDPE